MGGDGGYPKKRETGVRRVFRGKGGCALNDCFYISMLKFSLGVFSGHCRLFLDYLFMI